VFERVAERSHRIADRVDPCPGAIDVCFERIDLLLRSRECLCGIAENGSRFVARTFGIGACAFACVDGNAGRFPARLEVAYLVGDLPSARRERRCLMTIELELLLPAIDIELGGVRALANRGRTVIRFGLFDPQPRQVGLDFGDACRRRRFALARAGRTRARRTAPFPSAGARPEAACIAVPSPPDVSARHAVSPLRKRCRQRG
jgi:hypothetical protein